MFINIARVAYYYKWSEKQVLDLTPKKLWAYSREIESLLAEEQLRLINAFTFPKLPLRDRRRIRRQYQKISDPFYKERQQKQAESNMKVLKGKYGYKGKR